MRIVADQPCWLFALLASGVLTVRHSPCLTSSDDDFRPVTEFLSEICYTPERSYSIKDKGMMFGKALITDYRVHEQCPGGSVAHHCAAESEEADNDAGIPLGLTG